MALHHPRPLCIDLLLHRHPRVQGRMSVILNVSNDVCNGETWIGFLYIFEFHLVTTF
jgi:hypothetical protein